MERYGKTQRINYMEEYINRPVMALNPYNVDDIGGVEVKNNTQYELTDNTLLNNLVLSKTRLRAKQSTTGHRHAGQEEVYFFIKGSGRMELDYKEFKVKAGDVILIEDNVFHRVHNDGDFFLDFICVFDGARGAKIPSEG
jgi:mannose-6-phosphate isomerase-like protein (cupin superfamily)